MNQTTIEHLTQEAIDYYREEGFKESSIRDGKTILFRRKGERKYCYPVNHVKTLQPIDYFLNDQTGPSVGLEDWVDLDALNDILKEVDPLLFLTIHHIIVLKNLEEVEACEQFMKRRLKRRCLGLHTFDKSHIIINLYRIMQEAAKVSSDSHEFFLTVVSQFYITLFHELGHATLRKNGLDGKFSALEEMEDEDEEAVVEQYADTLFDDLDWRLDVFQPFNYERIVSCYEAC